MYPINVVGRIRGTKFEERRETIEMRIKGNLSYIRLLVPVLLFTGVQMFAQAAADSKMPVAGPAAHKTTRPHASVLLISDRTFIMKSIQGIAMNQSSKSQSAGTVARPILQYESSRPGCASSIFSVGVAKPSSGECPEVDCPAPPPGCYYEGPPDTAPNGCPINCGHLVCGPETN
jgi:hypothetical protein